jgi:transposase-like protein
MQERGMSFMDKKKPKHEAAMEEAKDLLSEGIGMSEIQNVTGLDERNINKARRKVEDRD